MGLWSSMVSSCGGPTTMSERRWWRPDVDGGVVGMVVQTRSWAGREEWRPTALVLWARALLLGLDGVWAWVCVWAQLLGRVHCNFGIDNLLFSGLEVVPVLELGQQRWRKCLAVAY
ncbi:hypothetical protein RchiOBHm_Chr4g0439251 [Rosa chinensis]|uniref:Uncharacterized protein n=1 Tax=Rosa chinensis TaxID=74649 RepID=A0A2P6R2Q0_ROSCH|nr:hypothetical protein RchiOBHm_Chr4g0439251 [Rosa chinensis]